MLLLAGDIGGTKTILRLVQSTFSEVGCIPQQLTLHQHQFLSQSYSDFVPMVQEFLLAAELSLGYVPRPEKACFAVAGPVINNSSHLTNLAWSLEADQLAQSLSLQQVRLINDFTAVSYGVLGLPSDQLYTLQAGQPDPHAVIGIIGAGTGLGQGFLTPKPGGGYMAHPSEGGHADFAPRSVLEFQLVTYLQDRDQLEHISVERVVSGQGIVSIYQFLRDRLTASELPEVAQAVRAWEQKTKPQKSVDIAAVIAVAAQQLQDPLCQETMQLFVKTYGAEAGNLALKLLPYGGLYLAGGIAAKNLLLIQSGEFIQAFNRKGRMRVLLERIPVHVVLDPQVGLIGAALYATEL
jgi:glucokinase